MKEVHTGRPETQQQKSSFSAVEAAGENRQAEQEPQIHRPVRPTPSQGEKAERYTTNRQQENPEKPGHSEEASKGRTDQQKATLTPEDEDLFKEIFGGETEEQINAHNERVSADREKERLEKERVREEALKQHEKYQARLSAMTPAEREEWERQEERIRTPLKPLTPEAFTKLIFKMHANVQAMQRKKAAWLHERDPRYDPMTGDLLESDELPLSPTSEYYFDGKTRPRRFVPGDSPHLNKYKELQIDEEDIQPEGEKHERFVERLLKAGFVEVEPTLADKASFEQTQWYRSLSPSEKMQFLQDSMWEMTRNRSFNKETAGEKFAKFIELLIDFLVALIAPKMMQKANRDQPDLKAA